MPRQLITVAFSARPPSRISSQPISVLPFSFKYFSNFKGKEGAYLGVEAELGKEGIRKVVETPLTADEKALLVEAYEAVKAKQADVKDM